MKTTQNVSRCLTGLAVAVLATGCSEQQTPMAPSEELPEPYVPSWGVVPDDVPSQSPAAPLAAPAPAAAIAQFANGSFETGDYTGWTLFEGGATTIPVFGTWGIATNGQTINLFQFVFDFFDGINVQQSSPGLPHTYTATDGNFVALQLQRGSQTHRMFQDIALPSGVTTISWDMEYNNHFGGFVPGNQVLQVNVRNPANDAILATLFSTTQNVDPQTIPMTTFTGDVSAFGGQTVRISVDMIVNLFFFDAAFDNFKIDIIPVDIDIKPGSDPNSINCNNENVSIAVAILTTDDFDATTVDHTTVTFEGASETHVNKKTSVARRHEEDVDGDGDTDLVLHFRLGDTDLDCGSTDGTLTGETFDGQAIGGADAVRMIDEGGGQA